MIPGPDTEERRTPGREAGRSARPGFSGIGFAAVAVVGGAIVATLWRLWIGADVVREGYSVVGP